jgi:hypothetical protein
MKKILFAAAMCLSATVFAQKNSFSGNWQINTQKTDFGKAPEWILPEKFTINQANNQITIIRLLHDPQLQAHVDTALLSYDNKVYENRSYSNKKQSYSLKWDADQKGFSITLHSLTDDNHPFSDITEKCSLSDDGKTLTINRKVEQASGLKYSIVAYYDKL